MSPLEVGVLFVAAILAGALNSVAGGGSFITFPALVTVANIPEINASATNTIALWPGSIASASAYRNELNTHRSILILLSSISLAGGLLGAILLRNTPQATFKQMVPYLLLFATLLFTFGGSITKRLKARTPKPEAVQAASQPQESVLLGVSVLQFATAVYGGFFGGGIGIVMLATLSLLGMENIHEMNAFKTWLATLINGIAVFYFAIQGMVYWPQGILMVAGAIIGGYGGAYYARKLDPLLVRRFVIVVGFVMTFYFFVFRR